MNNSENIAVIILAAGHGTRMKSDTPKVLHSIGGLTMLGHVIRAAQSLSPERICVVIGDHAPQVGEEATALEAGVQVYTQSPPRGTGDAVRCAMPGLEGFEGTVFVLYADTPLISSEILTLMKQKINAGAGVAVLGFTPEEPGAYGRLIMRDDVLDRIVEAKDASDEELAVTLCNSGVLAVRSDVLARELPRITNENAKGEFYLTDIVGLAAESGAETHVVVSDPREVLGVNSRVELAEAEAVFQSRARRTAMLEGATLEDPQTVYFSYDTKIAPDVCVGQNVVFGPGVTVGKGATVKAFSHLEGASIDAGATIGPFARLRPGTKVGPGAKVGNFVEVKKAVLGEGAKVSHLSYIGDAHVGAGANIGAGTITCNYDGYRKYRTVIGRDAFIGSNSSLVAPVTVADNAYVGSGSVITKDVESEALAVARGRQAAIPGWAMKFRKKMSSTDQD